MPLHPVFAAAIESARLAKRPALSAGSVFEARSLIDDGAKALGEGPAVAIVNECPIPSRGGTLSARFYRPAITTPGLVVYFHGGGWVAGSPAGFDALARTLAARSGCSVLLVDYRLAPENIFPSAVEDVEDAIRWASGQLQSLAGPNAKLVIAGDSAGANLATVAALALCNEIDIALQVLLYPVVDLDMDTLSYREHAEGLPLTRSDMRWFFSHYAPESKWADPRISPLRADLKGAPPAWIAVAEYDVLRSEGEAYGQQLLKVGVPVHCKVYAGLAHGFARWFNLVDVANAAIDEAAQAILSACTIEGLR